ncbi:MAG TPA: helix-turn-helix domain-containing protein [Acidimicrobiia bacterium]|nr:helix-turn-helix domain-containing protein [Acidimicrobiia bacterium]
MTRQVTDLPVQPLASEPVAARLIDALLASIAEVGLAKTALDDVARAAGCSRATLYRYFPGKQPLLAAAIEREAARLGATLAASAELAETLDDAVVAVVVAAAEFLERHPALRTLLEVEPQLLLAEVGFERGDRVVRRGGELAAAALERLLPAEEAARLGEWVTRIVLSYFFSPSESVSLTRPESVRVLVSEFVLPGVVPAHAIRG